MDADVAAILASWSFAPWLALSLGLSAAVYLRGWRRLRRRGVRSLDATNLACFLGGLATIYVALMSPLDALAPLLMQAHMVQHLLLMVVAPPLIWLGSPELPMIAGLPLYFRRTWLIPLWQMPTVQSSGRWLTRPAVAWTISVAVLWFWHVPAMYQWTLENRFVHDVEHLSFLASSLLFWWPVMVPYPRRRAFSDWVLLPYLFLAGLQASVLSGILTFSERVLYPHYDRVPRLWGMTALADQAIGGAIMWTLGSLALLIPLAVIGRRLLYSVPAQARTGGTSGTTERARAGLGTTRGAGLLPTLTQPCFHPPNRDVLRIPLLGRLLRARQTRWVVQCAMFGLAIVIVLDGLFGPQVSPVNLAGTAPWIHWRWLVVVGLLAAGNLTCFACPFTLPRRILSRWLPAAWNWPRWLTGKLPAIALLVLFFWAYELLALWDSPWWTAWLVIGYFALALAIDGLFRGKPFCRYVCPIGQFNFVYSLVSPLTVGVRNPAACSTCTSHACLRGSGNVAGCETGLFQPQKQGNLDCTFCLACVRSCPHDNVGVIVGLPTAALSQSDRLDGGRMATRTEVTTLIVVLTAAAFVNAAWMITPRNYFDFHPPAWSGSLAITVAVTVGTLLGLLFIPLTMVTVVAIASHRATQDRGSWKSNAGRFMFCLIPLGLGMWGAHYTYHFLTGFGTIVGAVWRFAADLGITAAANWSWACPCCGGQLDGWLRPSQFLLFDLGLVTSLYVAYAIARRHHGRSRRALAEAAPWGILLVAMYVAGVFILLQPMQMRGTLGFVAGGGP